MSEAKHGVWDEAKGGTAWGGDGGAKSGAKSEGRSQAKAGGDSGYDDLIAAAKGTSLETYAMFAGAESKAEPKRSQSPRRSLILLTDEERSELNHRTANSTSTMFAKGTIAVPDMERILVSIGLIMEHMIKDPSAHDPLQIEISNEQCRECTASMVFHFLSESMALAMWSPECNIVALVLVTRLVGHADALSLTDKNWEKILLIAVMLAQKVWDDAPLANADFPKVWANLHPDENFSLEAINEMEQRFLVYIHFEAHVSIQVYTRFYFELLDVSNATFNRGQPLSRATVGALC